jgi:hypothetical protein
MGGHDHQELSLRQGARAEFAQATGSGKIGLPAERAGDQSSPRLPVSVGSDCLPNMPASRFALATGFCRIGPAAERSGLTAAGAAHAVSMFPAQLLTA